MHINWSSPEILMVLISFIGNTILICSIIIYNYSIIKPNRLLPMFIVRRPTFSFIFMLCCTLGGFIRCVVSFIKIIYPFWNPIWYYLLARASFYFGTFSFSVARMWLLYYDINCVRKQQTHLLSKYLHLQPQYCKKNYDINFFQNGKRKRLSQSTSITHKYMNHNNHDKKRYLELESKSSKSLKNIQPKYKVNNINNICGNITTTNTIINNITMNEIINIHGKYHSLYGSSSSITFGMILLTVIILIITLLLDAQTDILFYTNFIYTTTFGLLTISFYGYLLLKLYQTDKNGNTLKRKFNDDWSLLTELVVLWILWFIGMCISIILLILYQFNYIIYIHGYIALFIFLWQFANITVCMYIPYKLMKQSQKSQQSNNYKYKRKKSKTTIRQILSENRSFVNFVSFSSEDSSIENLAFLVEVWQFKFQNEFNLNYTNSDYIWRNNSNESKNDPINITISTHEDEDIDNISDNDNIYEIIDDDNDNDNDNDENMDGFIINDYNKDLNIIRGLEFPESDSSQSQSQSQSQYEYKMAQDIKTPLPLFNQISVEKKKCVLNILKSMPWSDLPLNKSIWKYRNDKWIQCQIIYNKFIVRDAPFALNISHCAFIQTQQIYEECIKSYNNNKSTENSYNNSKILNIFDNIIPEVFDNLDNVASRFNEKL